MRVIELQVRITGTGTLPPGAAAQRTWHRGHLGSGRLDAVNADAMRRSSAALWGEPPGAQMQPNALQDWLCVEAWGAIKWAPRHSYPRLRVLFTFRERFETHHHDKFGVHEHHDKFGVHEHHHRLGALYPAGQLVKGDISSCLPSRTTSHGGASCIHNPPIACRRGSRARPVFCRRWDRRRCPPSL